MAEHFTPVYPFRIILTKVPPSRNLSKMFIFVLVPRNLIMSGVRPDSILSPFWKSSHRLLLISQCKRLYDVPQPGTHNVGLPTQYRSNVGPASQPIFGSMPVNHIRRWPNI